MEQRFCYNHYYIPEFYNKVLKQNHTITTGTHQAWSLENKIDFIDYMLKGFPCTPILLAPTNKSQCYECIDGYERINLIRDFMLGGLDTYMDVQKRDIFEKLSIDVYICETPLKKEDMTHIRTSFHCAPVVGNGSGSSGSSSESRSSTSANDKENTIMIGTNVRTVVATLKTRIPKKQIHEALKTSVWNKYIGSAKGTALCYCCKQTQITQREFDTGHVIAEVNGGQTHIENLRPICRKCNLSMGIANMEDFRTRYFA